ncbi:App1 family protein [uncultured Polaribacter sp.]|uniref:App1 family protein n=1 Tax=uncultured Polaribacter sp. TaxID=174711 RepID=UPI00260B05CC|nr:phosphatase domain-containing protein [uncultured Polaribacter sp.]
MPFFKKDSLQIIVFQSYGTNNHFYTRGRALEDENINLERKNILGLLINSWKRFESDEIKNTALTITLPNNFKIETVTDNDGYFIVDEKIENLHTLTNSEGWLNFEISFSNANVSRKINNGNRFPGELLIPSENSDFGIISDIDDTILHTGVISKLKWRVLLNTFFVSPFKRKALVGSSDFYSLLHLGKSGKNANPLYYVSHSPWNLYRYLELFLKENKFPKGAILLRSFNTILKKKSLDEKPQKQKEIINILKTYQDLSFILIGDAGEYDADIYMEITKKYPNRIKAIYLRSVLHSKKMERIETLIKDYSDTKFLIVNASKEAIAHAKENGFIA